MRSQDYGRVWDLITQQSDTTSKDTGPDKSLSNHISTPANAFTELSPLDSMRKRKGEITRERFYVS